MSRISVPPTLTAHETIELTINESAWEKSLRSQLVRGSPSYAVGSLRTVPGHRHRRLMLDALVETPALPRGDRRSARDDFAVLAMIPDGDPISAAELISRTQPQPSQGVAIVVLRSRPAWGWDAAWRAPHQSGSPVSIDRLRILGPSLLKLSREPVTALEDHVRERWSRTMGALGETTFRKLREATVSVVGTGRNGSCVATMLAAFGVQHLRLIDPDVLELGNLDSGVARHRDIGRSKVEVLGRRLLSVHADLRVSCIADSVLSSSAVDRLQGSPSDLFVTCVDSDTARLAVSLLARGTLTPHLDIGTLVRRENDAQAQLSADVRLLLPTQGCCRCVGGLANEEQTLYELAAPPGVLARGEPTGWQGQRAGSLMTLNSIACGSGVQLFLDLLAGRVKHSTWLRLVWRDQEGLVSNRGSVTRGDTCTICRIATAGQDELASN